MKNDIPEGYYDTQIKKAQEITDKSYERILSFWQHILLVFSSIDCILISLHVGNSGCIYTRVAFVLSTFLLTLGVLSATIVVYDLSMLVERTRQVFLQELQIAIRQNHRVGSIVAKKKKRTVFCEIFSCVSFVLALFSMLIYTLFHEFPQIGSVVYSFLFSS